MLRSRSIRPLAALAMLPLFAIGVGCVGYTSYNPTEGDQLGDSSLNAPAVRAVLTRSLRFTIERMPPELSEDEARLNVLAPTSEREVAVSLPRGLTKAAHDQILASLGDAVSPIVDGNEGLPIYRVGELRIRGNSATVDVHRPLDETNNRFQTPYQCITLSLRSDLEGWRVEGYEAWMPGTVQLPALNALRTPAETETPEEPETELAAEEGG